jgi:predicted aspartyl protease
MLSLPQDLVEKLGLFVPDKEVVVTYANGSKGKKKIAKGVNITLLGREALTDCIIEKKGTQVLVGQIPLEEMDLVVDPKNGKVSPRPESPDIPLIEMY